MSAATATLYGALIAGVFTVVGVVAGLAVEDRLRRRGEVRFEVRAWVNGLSTQSGSEYRDFEARFFNDRDVNVSLWNLEVEFHEGDAVTARMIPAAPGTGAGPRSVPIEPIELPSRTSVYQTMRLEASDQYLENVKRGDHATFVATVVPGNEQISAPLRRWSPYELARPWPIHRSS